MVGFTPHWPPRRTGQPATRHVHRIHAVQRRSDAVQRDIGCRCIQLPTQFLPVLNTAGHFKRPTEEALRAVKIGVGQRARMRVLLTRSPACSRVAVGATA